jgi:hypothetical protein
MASVISPQHVSTPDRDMGPRSRTSGEGWRDVPTLRAWVVGCRNTMHPRNPTNETGPRMAVTLQASGKPEGKGGKRRGAVGHGYKEGGRKRDQCPPPLEIEPVFAKSLHIDIATHQNPLSD